jgi:ABC-type polysaccharide/polyol phosphate export systems, permease component
MKRIKEIFDYRQMIFSLVKKDLRGRYKGSVLGFFWTFLNPLLQLVVYTLVFSIILDSTIEKFYLYLFVALVPWLFFSSSLTGGSSCIMANQDMVKKIYFPREVLPLSYVTGAFVNMLFCFIVIFGVIIFSGHGINIKAIAYLPIIMLVEYVLALGGAMLTSALTVFFRDLEYILGIITMAWMYMTPIMYGIEIVPQALQPVFKLNPMTPIVVAYRDILYWKRVPEIGTLLQGFVLGVLILVVGYILFGKLQKGFAEEM